MIPYKFFDLNARDQTGVLLSNIMRYQNVVDNSDLVSYSIYTVPPDNALLITSICVEGQGELGGPPLTYFLGGGMYVLDAQGNPINQLYQRSPTSGLIGGFPVQNPAWGAVTISGSPLLVVGPNLEIILEAKFNNLHPNNEAFFGLNGVLIPRGTMAYQT